MPLPCKWHPIVQLYLGPSVATVGREGADESIDRTRRPVVGHLLAPENVRRGSVESCNIDVIGEVDSDVLSIYVIVCRVGAPAI